VEVIEMSPAVSTSDTQTATTEKSSGTRIVVGVDGSPASMQALKWAVRQAKLTGAGVEAVNVYTPQAPAAFAFGAYPMLALDPTLAHEAAEIALESAIHRALPEESHQAVQRITVAEHSAARALTRVAADAEMLVVGVVHHHGLGLLLGSTAATCIRHTEVPVVVVPFVEAQPAEAE
jgi:nucleotide-binding universal stress UspA family protein